MTGAASLGSSCSSTSPTWLEGIRQREPAAWKRLTDLYGPLIYQWAQRAGLRGADAADVLQDVFLAVATSIDAFTQSGQGTFRGWLWTITRSKVCDCFRRRRAGDRGIGGSEAQWRLAELPEPWSDDTNDATRSEAQQLFQRALELIRAEFEPRTWAAFWRSVVDGEPTSAIAADLTEYWVLGSGYRVLSTEY
jgi:RNA polymerase sigma-70 factor (ECF subfamily)